MIDTAGAIEVFEIEFDVFPMGLSVIGSNHEERILEE